MVLKLLSLFVLLSAYQIEGGRSPQFITLIAPSTIYDKAPYSAHIRSSEVNKNVEVFVKLRNYGAFYEIYKDGYETIDEIRFDSMTLNQKQSKVPLKIVARQDEKCVSKEITLVNAPVTHVLIQLDKPFYKPGDEIKYRIVAFDRDTKPITMNSIEVEIRDGEGNLVEAQKSLRGQKFVQFGLFEGTFPINSSPSLGTWSITPRINNNTEMVASKNFKVIKPQVPYFELFVESEDIFALDQEELDFKIFGKYFNGTFAKGTAKVKVYAVRIERILFESSYKIDVLTNVKLNIRKDLNIKFLAIDPLELKIQIEFFDENLVSRQVATKNIRIFYHRKHSIEIINSYPLIEGFDFEFDVVVRTFDGKVIKESYEPVRMSYLMICEEESQGRFFQRKNQIIKNSAAHFKIDNEPGVKEIRITVIYMNDRAEFVVHSKGDDSMRISVNKPIDNDFEATIKSTKKLNEVFALVTGRNRIVYSKTHQCYGRKKCYIHFDGISRYYHEMMPISKLVVYSMQEGSKILYGSTSIKFSESSFAKLKISAASNATAKSEINITVSSHPNSIVSLLAIDKKMLFIRDGHDITKQDVIDALTKTKKFVNDRSVEDNDVTFDEENKNYIVNLPLDQWRECKEEETKSLDKIFKIGITWCGPKIIYSSNLELEKASIENEEEENETKEEEGDFMVSKDYATPWIWETIEIDERGKGHLSLKVPDTATTWIFTGFSISDEGFSVAEPQKFASTKEFFIEIHTSTTMKFNEISKFEVLAFNFIPKAIDEDIEVELKVIAQHQFEFLNDSNLAQNETYQSIMLNVPHQSGVRKIFTIKPLIKDEMTIRVEAKVKNLQGFFDEAEKKILIEN